MAERADLLTVLLAAGAARRFGGGKLDAPVAGRPLGTWSAIALQRLPASGRLIVVPPTPPAFVDALEGWDIATNPMPERGIGGSIAIAARHAAAYGFERMVVALADMPLVPSDHFAALADGDAIAFTRYPDGSPGVPAAFPQRRFAALAELTSGGAAEQDWGEEIALIAPRDGQALSDVDEQGDLPAVERLFLERADRKPPQ
ncbi:NTP transferase domain-containing protein [Erythrobacter sp. LQ02-29]|uniref:nucleotidyltransferase family protein n=1 Tax=Erythrobacter sp. LQ02-29 TaxID=2920384 RepID=UPI001F4DFE68|nr:NTP transferase domain-containing protein [Erythrobacter sp. LQ02-29]MCP9222090.1 NTP transferase domain-containing protein [Erythrobacter sp. LQ02-29]